MTYLRPVAGKITSKFGNRIHPISGKLTFHNGVDISCPVGSDIIAPDSGTITEYWDHPRGGKCLAMVNAQGVRFGFAHLGHRLVKKDQLVNKGDHIAESGNTGASTGPHLHFTVKVNDQWQDPLKFINV